MSDKTNAECPRCGSASGWHNLPCHGALDAPPPPPHDPPDESARDYAPPSPERGFERELESLLNRYSQENASDTPDFILAQYLLACLAAWNTGVQQRETWWGRDPRPRETKP